jgi:hypothetical protein
MRSRILFLALILALIQAPVIANPTSPAKCTKFCAPAIGPAGGYVYKYVGGKQQRKAINNRWETKDARKESTFDPIRVAAYKAINSLVSDPNFSNIKFEYIVRPGYPKPIEQTIRLQLEKVAARFSPLLTKQDLVKVIMVTQKDKNWVQTELPKIVPGEEYGFGIPNLDFYSSKDDFYSRAGTGGGIAFHLPEKGYAYYISHTSTLATLETYWPEVAPHEFAHVFQGLVTNSYREPYPNGHPDAKWNGHLIEGSANTLGMALGFETLGWYSDEMDRIFKRDIRNYRSWRKMNNLQDAVAFIKAIEPRDGEQSAGFSYSAGQFVWEFFIGKYGFDKYVELLRNLPNSSNFNENLRATIGKDREAFYKEAGEYLLKNWKRLS